MVQLIGNGCSDLNTVEVIVAVPSLEPLLAQNTVPVVLASLIRTFMACRLRLGLGHVVVLVP